MGTVHRHSDAAHLRGRVGNFIYKWYGDRLVVTALPRKSTKARSPKQRKSSDRFTEASAYAERARKEPEVWKLYTAAAKKRRIPPRSVAMQDYLTRPKVGSISLGGFSADVGTSVIDLGLNDKHAFKTAGIDVMIRGKNGKLLDQGAAERFYQGWRYRLQQPVPRAEVLEFEVTARDRFGKTTTRIFHGRVRDARNFVHD
jgi:hypothetical protein